MHDYLVFIKDIVNRSTLAFSPDVFPLIVDIGLTGVYMLTPEQPSY